MPTVHDLIAERLGTRTRSAENREAIVMGAAPLVVLRNDSSRLALVIVNLGATTVFIRPDGVPSVTAGFRLAANGGFMALNYIDDLTLVAKEFTGVDPIGAAELWVTEELIAAGEVV